jgi:hypothetical protein
VNGAARVVAAVSGGVAVLTGTLFFAGEGWNTSQIPTPATASKTAKVFFDLFMGARKWPGYT